MQSLVRWLWFFLIITVTLELLEIIMLAYENAEPWHIISPLLTTRLQFSFISMQMIIGGLIPFILLFIVVTMNRYLHDRVRNTLAFIAVAAPPRPGLLDALERRHRRPAPLEVVPRPALRVRAAPLREGRAS